jgi:hypothetical protein
MNPLNYGSREACQRLTDAGIVLETEFCWLNAGSDIGYVLRPSRQCKLLISIPAPSMAEVWRELPRGIYLLQGDKGSTCWSNEKSYFATNATDALIDLLIWVRKEGK